MRLGTCVLVRTRDWAWARNQVLNIANAKRPTLRAPNEPPLLSRSLCSLCSLRARVRHNSFVRPGACCKQIGQIWARLLSRVPFWGWFSKHTKRKATICRRPIIKKKKKRTHLTKLLADWNVTCIAFTRHRGASTRLRKGCPKEMATPSQLALNLFLNGKHHLQPKVQETSR